MLDEPRVPAALSTGLQRAAVLVGLAAYPGEVRVVLKRRTMALRVHAGQIAFPGGKIEAQSPAAAVAFKINPDAAIEAFEMHFAFLMNAANHRLRHEEFAGKPRYFHAMPYGAGNIWGATAGILRNLYERLYS